MSKQGLSFHRDRSFPRYPIEKVGGQQSILYVPSALEGLGRLVNSYILARVPYPWLATTHRYLLYEFLADIRPRISANLGGSKVHNLRVFLASAVVGEVSSVTQKNVAGNKIVTTASRG